jgi:hypothetical protein
LDPNLESILLSPLRIPSESGVAITPHPLIGFALEYMRWKALLRDFPLDGVLSTTTCDKSALDPFGVRGGDNSSSAHRICFRVYALESPAKGLSTRWSLVNNYS